MMIYNHTHVYIVQLVDIHFMFYVVKIGYIADENCTYETDMYKNTLQQHIKKNDNISGNRYTQFLELSSIRNHLQTPSYTNQQE